jgi:hypothetical protein
VKHEKELEVLGACSEGIRTSTAISCRMRWYYIILGISEDAIRSQLKVIRSGSGKAARFAQKVQPARSTEIYFPAENDLSKAKSKYEPDTSFWHDDAEYPGVIVEVAYSQKRRRLDRLAENYLIDSDASVRVVVGLDVEYGRKKTSKATLSVWRTQLVHTADGDELRVIKEVIYEVFATHSPLMFVLRP